MFAISRVLSNISLKKQFSLFSKMPEFNAADLRLLENHVKDGENMISYVKEEIKKLISQVQKNQESIRMQKLMDENTKLMNEIRLAKKELIHLQVANGVVQIPVPGEESEKLSRQSAESTQESAKHSDEHSNQPETGVSSENVSKESKPSNTSKPKKVTAPMAEESPVDVGRLDIRVGKVLHAQVHPDADQLYIEQIDIGEEISRTVVSGLVRHIPLAELDQRMVLVLCNLKPQKMRGIVSEAMVLCASTPETVELLIPPPEAKAGDNITVPGYPRNPDLPFMNPKKKIFEKVSLDLKVNNKKQASYKDVPWEVEGKSGYVTVQALSGCYIK